MHDRFGDPVDRTAGAAVDPRRGPIGEQDVGLPACLRSDGFCLDPPPPSRWVEAGVVAVGPHEEMESFPEEREAGTELEGGSGLGFRGAQLGIVDREFDHDRFAFGPRLVESIHEARERLIVGNTGVVHNDNGRGEPGHGYGAVGRDDDRAAESGGSGCGHDREVRDER